MFVSCIHDLLFFYGIGYNRHFILNYESFTLYIMQASIDTKQVIMYLNLASIVLRYWLRKTSTVHRFCLSKCTHISWYLYDIEGRILNWYVPLNNFITMEFRIVTGKSSLKWIQYNIIKVKLSNAELIEIINLLNTDNCYDNFDATSKV